MVLWEFFYFMEENFMKQKLLKNIKILSILFTFVVLIANSIPAFAATSITGDNVLNIAFYEDKWFTDCSEAEPITLHMDADSISLYAVCANHDATDMILCHITDLNGGSYNLTIPFDADGSVTTDFISIPAGKYRVFFTGNVEYIEHAIVAFTVVL